MVLTPLRDWSERSLTGQREAVETSVEGVIVSTSPLKSACGCRFKRQRHRPTPHAICHQFVQRPEPRNAMVLDRAMSRILSSWTCSSRARQAVSFPGRVSNSSVLQRFERREIDLTRDTFLQCR